MSKSLRSVLLRNFYTRSAPEVARDLLGRVLATNINGALCKGRIIETEAYLPEHDEASHSSRGKTARNTAMFLPGGHSYVYFIYGMYYCFNVVTGQPDSGEAVLIRSVELIEGSDIAIGRRGKHVNHTNLANGPGKLTIAMGIGPEQNGMDLTEGKVVWLEQGECVPDSFVMTTPRIGISKAQSLPLRWCLSQQ